MFYVAGFAGEVQGGFIHAVQTTLGHSIFRESEAVQQAIQRGQEVVRRLGITQGELARFYPIRETIGFMFEPLEQAHQRGTLYRVGGEMFVTMFPVQARSLSLESELRRTRDVMRRMGTLYSAANRGVGVGSIQVDEQPNRLIVVENTPYDCVFHEGLFAGVARYCGESWSIVQTECRHRGATACRYEMTLK
jgi:predicted hydrocarbon binding protein